MENKTSQMRRRLAMLLAVCLLCVYPSAFAGDVRKEGDSGDDVRLIQERLAELNYYTEAPSGVFDTTTAEAVTLFQQTNNLLASGMVDEVTRRVLFSDEALAYIALSDSDQLVSKTDSFAAPSLAGYMRGAYNTSMLEEINTNEYHYFEPNGFQSVLTSPLSTFAADVDNASYTQIRSKILSGEPVPVASVRVEEMLNYFHYDYAEPQDGEPFGVTMELSDCPWNEQTKLLLIGLQAKRIPDDARPAQNLVFLIDVSGSMNVDNKLPLVKRAFTLLLDTLSPTDTVSLVTYASYDRVVLDGVPAANKSQILDAFEHLSAGGATAGAKGIQTAYEIAQNHFLPDGNNRILLATDGDLNVGTSDEGSLVKLVEEKRQGGVMLSVLGFGDGNYKDNKLEALADFGNGNYHYIDTVYEARRTLVTEAGANFFSVAKDVKLQLDFNPTKVKGYRLIGYENRVMSAEDFANDNKDGGEIGSGHRMTALYEIVPTDSDFDFGGVTSKYQTPMADTQSEEEWLTLNIRAKNVDSDVSQLYTYPLKSDHYTDTSSDNCIFAAAVAEFGMLLTDNEWKGSATWDGVLELLRSCESVTGDPLKEEFLYMTTLMQRAE